MHTTDGGANWRVLDGYATPLNQPGTPDWRVAVGTAAPSNILAHVYDPARSTGRAFHVLEDATGLWRQVAIPVDAPVASASFPAAARAWLVGSDTFQSIDYAHTFRRAQNPEGMSLAASFPPVPDGAVARGLGVGPGGRIFRWEPDPAGDVNGDGFVNLADAILAMALAAAGDAGTTPGHAPTDALSRRMADIDPAPDGDGLLTPADAAAILRKAGGQGK
jgi:hypothetical protein